MAIQTRVWKDSLSQSSFSQSSLPLFLSTAVHTAIVLLLALCISTEPASHHLTIEASFAVDNDASIEMIAPIRVEEQLHEWGDSDGPIGPQANSLSLNDLNLSDFGLTPINLSLKTKQESQELEVDARFGKKRKQQVHHVYTSATNAPSKDSAIRFGGKQMPGARQASFASAQSLEVIVPGLDPYGSSVLSQASNLSLTGGAMMVSTAKPHSSLAKVPLSFEYDKSNIDGKRMVVIAGDQRSVLSIYDWELQPLARFVDAGHHGAVDIRMFGKHEKVSLDAAFERTLLGLRFIQADLMARGVIMSQEYLPQDDRGILLGPGELERLSSDQAVRDAARELEPLMARTRNGAPYSVLTDAKVHFEFEIVGNELVISGIPYFFFWEPAKKGDHVVPRKALNDQLKKAWPKIKQANPLVIESMERSFRSVALFRFQKQNSPVNWGRFTQQLQEISLEKIPTPSLLSAE